MTFRSKSWQQERDERVASIDEHRKRRKMLRQAHKASRRWVKSREALSTMQFLAWHLQKPFE